MRVRVIDQANINMLDEVAKEFKCSMQEALTIVLNNVRKLKEAEHGKKKNENM